MPPHGRHSCGCCCGANSRSWEETCNSLGVTSSNASSWGFSSVAYSTTYPTTSSSREPKTLQCNITYQCPDTDCSASRLLVSLYMHKRTRNRGARGIKKSVAAPVQQRYLLPVDHALPSYCCPPPPPPPPPPLVTFAHLPFLYLLAQVRSPLILRRAVPWDG